MKIPHILSLLLAMLSTASQGATTVNTKQKIATGTVTYNNYSIILTPPSANPDAPMMWVYGGATLTLNNAITDKFQGDAVGLTIGDEGNSIGTVKATDLIIDTTGKNHYGISIVNAGSKITFYGSNNSITTDGDSAHGILLSNGATWTLGATEAKTFPTITVTTFSALLAADGSNSALTFNTGFYLRPQTGKVDTYGVQASRRGSVTMNSGSSITMDSDRNFGIYALEGGTATLNAGSLITVGGVGSHGVYVKNGTLNLNGGTISTTGQSAGAIVLDGDSSSLTASAKGTITTTGDGAHGIVVTNGTQYVLKSSDFGANLIYFPNIKVSHQGVAHLAVIGANSSLTLDDGQVKLNFDTAAKGTYGLFVDDGATGSVTRYSSIRIMGDNTVALFVNKGGIGNVVYDGQYTLSAYGSGASAAYVRGQLNLDGASLFSNGTNATTVVLEGSSANIFFQAAKSTITSSGQIAHGILFINGASRTFTGTDTKLFPNIIAQGMGSALIAVSGSNSSVTFSGTQLTDINTQNMSDSTFGFLVTAGASGSITNKASIQTTGTNASTARVENTGSLTISGISDSTGYTLSAKGSKMKALQIYSTSDSASTANISDARIISNGANSNAVDMFYGGDLTATTTSFETIGHGATAIHASTSAGVSHNINLENSTVKTTGANAYGILTIGDGSDSNPAINKIALKGTTSITTSGAGAHGLVAKYLGDYEFNFSSQSTITTSGVGAHGIVAAFGANLTLDGVNGLPTITVTGEGSAYLAALAQDPESDDPSQAIFGTLSVTNAARFIFGTTAVPSKSGTIGFLVGETSYGNVSTFGSISITGDGTTGMVIKSAGTGSLAYTSPTDGYTLNATGAGAVGVSVQNGGTLSLSGATVTTNGLNARGIILDGINAKMTSSAKSYVSTTGQGAIGIYLANNANFTAPDIVISTKDSGAYGMYFDDAANAVLNNTSITTSGQGAHGISLDGGYTTFSTTGAASSITTSGQGAHGIYANNDAYAFTATGLTVTTKNDTAHGIYLDASGKGTLDNTTIITKGDGAHGVSLNGTYTNLLTTANASSITTEGENSYGIYAQNDYSSLSAGNLAITTKSSSSHGIVLDVSGKATLDNTTISTLGESSHGIVMKGFYTSLTFGSTASLIKTALGDSHGISVQGGARLTINASTLAPYIEVKGAESALYNATGTNSLLEITERTITGTFFKDDERYDSGANTSLIKADTAGKVTISNSKLEAAFSNGARLAHSDGASALIEVRATNGLLQNGSATGYYATNNGKISLTESSSVVATNHGSSTLVAENEGDITASDGAFATLGSNADAVQAKGSDSSVTLTDSTINTGVNVQTDWTQSNFGKTTGGTLAVSNSHGAHASDGGEIVINGTSITTGGDASHAIFADGKNSTVRGGDNTINSLSSDGVRVKDGAVVNLSRTDITAISQGTSAFRLSGTGNNVAYAYGTITSNTAIKADSSSSGVATLYGITYDQGDGLLIDAGSASTLQASLQNSTVTGNIHADSSADMSFTLDGSLLIGYIDNGNGGRAGLNLTSGNTSFWQVTSSSQLGTLSLNSGTTTITLGSGASEPSTRIMNVDLSVNSTTVSFDNSSSQSWSGQLVFENVTSHESIQFGVNLDGLTRAQMNKITVYDALDGHVWSRVDIDTNGYLYEGSIPEPSSSTLLIGALAFVASRRRRAC